jgi:sulfatase maturation enzyme AslB (radical SAM superfamily)
MTKNYCAAPWRGLHIQTDGGISTCCAGGFKLGNINKDTIESALSSDKIKAVRESIKKGHLHKDYCKICIDANSAKVTNEQFGHNLINDDFDLSSAGTDYQFPVTFDARWDNTCNSTCIYCGPMWSSKWASIKSDHQNKPNNHNKSKIHEYFSLNGDRLKSVSMIGGEPLLMKENEVLLETIPDHVDIGVITNFSTDITKSKVFEKLMQRRKVNWHVSIENVGERYEYVRQGSKWNQLLDNLKILGSAVRNPPEHNDHEIQFLSLFHILNATRLCELKEFTKQATAFFPKKYNGDSQVETVWQIFHFPEALCIDMYGKEVLQKAIVEIQKYLQMELNPTEKTFFENKLESYQKIDVESTPKIKSKFSDFITNNEKTFNKDGHFLKLWPELSFLLDKK